MRLDKIGIAIRFYVGGAARRAAPAVLAVLPIVAISGPPGLRAVGSVGDKIERPAADPRGAALLPGSRLYISPRPFHFAKTGMICPSAHFAASSALILSVACRAIICGRMPVSKTSPSAALA